MEKKYSIFQKNNGISPYIWAILCILPLYFIFESPTTLEVVIGLITMAVFFIIYRLAFIFTGWSIYLWGLFLIVLSVLWTLIFNYIYFSFFVAYYIGNIKRRVPFFIFYFVLLISTSVAININIIEGDTLFLTQIPFIIITWIGIILLPFTIRNRSKVEQLEEKLQSANEKIEELIKIEERERIARDLHDTLGQKLSLIGLKSDLARKLISSQPERAKEELVDVQQTARTALNEVRKLVSSMRTLRLEEEFINVEQLLQAAEIQCTIRAQQLEHSNLLLENILSMCVKEAVTNVVKHSEATQCEISVKQSWSEITIIVHDNGTFKVQSLHGNGLKGMKERLEFVNGSLHIRHSENGTTLEIRVPNDTKQRERERAK